MDMNYFRTYEYLVHVNRERRMYSFLLTASVFLLMLVSGKKAVAQLSQQMCERAIEIKHLQTVKGNFASASNNIESYLMEEGYTGREIIYKIDLPEDVWGYGVVFIDFTGDAEKLMIFKNCTPGGANPPFVSPGFAQRYNGLSSGTYYIIIEGPKDGSNGNFEFTFRRDHLGRCDDGSINQVQIGKPTDPTKIKFTTTADYDYVWNYCGDPDPSKSLKNWEAVYKLANWPGGDFKATLNEMEYNNDYQTGSVGDLAMILLSDCNTPKSCVGSPVVNDGNSELVMEYKNLPAGDYFIVVDGKADATAFSKYKFKLTVDPPPAQTTVKDADGNEYPVVTIPVKEAIQTGEGTQTKEFTQTWMAENLKTTTCLDETPLTPFKQADSRDVVKLSSKPGYIWYNNDENHPNSQKYGPVYNWTAVSSETCKVCPDGYRIPTERDWQLLVRSWYYTEDKDGNLIEPDKPTRGAGLAYAGKQLRAKDESWVLSETNTNSSGFSALPGGWLWNGSFRYLRNRSAWWGIASGGGYNLRFAKIARGEQGTWLGRSSKIDVLYVRCIKDE